MILSSSAGQPSAVDGRDRVPGVETEAVGLYPLAPDPDGRERWMPGHVPDGTDRTLPAERIHRSLVAPVREVMEALRAARTGQALDIQGHREEMDRAVAGGDAAGLLEVVRLTHRLKSGAMVGAVLEMAALFTAAGPALRGALTAFGSALGTAHQIADDVADPHGATRQGKATRRTAEDLHHGKITMPLAHSVRLMPPPELNAVWRTLRTGAPSLREVERAREAIEARGAPAACAEEARALLDGAWTRLRPLLPDEPAADRIHDSARAFVDGNLFS